MVRLSVNVNKVATLRNSRGGDVPSLTEAVGVVLDAGARGITVHPRADQRHITPRDVRDLAAQLAPRRASVEYNIEGDPRPELLALVHEVRPHQCTLVPVKAGEITSQAGWPPDTPRASLVGVIAAMQQDGIRVSLFVDPDVDAVTWARDLGADRVEIYTEPYARAFERGPEAAAAGFAACAAAAERAHALGLGVNAGHDLDLTNLPLFRTLPHLAEVSIGHALMSRALFVGLHTAVREYLAAVEVSG
jgi:pyridoxine 5-phosphate synthase